MQEKLYGKQESTKLETSLPPVLHIVRTAALQKIPDGLMERLNYYDLKAMVLENWIDQVKSALERKENERLNNRGVNRRKATQDEINAMH
mgnify:CR=1 FL=1